MFFASLFVEFLGKFFCSISQLVLENRIHMSLSGNCYEKKGTALDRDAILL